MVTKTYRLPSLLAYCIIACFMSLAIEPKVFGGFGLGEGSRFGFRGVDPASQALFRGLDGLVAASEEGRGRFRRRGTQPSRSKTSAASRSAYQNENALSASISLRGVCIEGLSGLRGIFRYSSTWGKSSQSWSWTS